ncbi:MAG: carboxylesterase/lipase family protein, partial [Deltaproteobacteria bacterium]|nr:carboxylesterase/lipase family protein [Deltaproteobacteria bacterium]
QMLLGSDAGAQSLATTIQTAWATFIRGAAPAAEALPRWPIYELPRRSTMLIDRESHVVDDPAGAQRALWP